MTGVVIKPFQKDCRGESISVRLNTLSVTQFCLDVTVIHRCRSIFSTVSRQAANCARTHFLQARYIVVIAAHEKTHLARSHHGSFFD